MGRGKRHWNRGNKDKNSGEKIDHSKNGSYDLIVKENKLFEKYYQNLNLMPASEWNQFIETLKQPLPVTFRITSYKSYANEILNFMKERHFKYLQSENEQNEASAESEIYKCLSWYPNELAWQVNLSRKDVRKNEKFFELKQFLIDMTESGNLSRQEAVSMIPPLLLDVKPHHKVLDLCASPGSKTAQLIEALHADKTNAIPEGFVVANDIDNKRCYMLVHQLKRLESPSFMIVNHDASVLPNFRVQTPEGQIKSIMYDRILADVPCSGDGTFRKNVDVWTKWNFAHACNLHGIQMRIARRAVELLQEEGLMVYSTCSLNPVENEAVVANLLQEFKGQLELVDARDKLAGLKTVNGLHTWNLMSKDGEIYNKVEEVIPKWANLLRPGMFPPSLEVAQSLHLERCIRVLPHHQNTGGFFIALIRKLKSDAPKEDETMQVETKEAEEKIETEANPPDPTAREMKAPPAKRLRHVFEENPFTFFDQERVLETWPLIKTFFGIRDDFPAGQLMTRNRKDENVRNVYFVSSKIAELVKFNGDRIKFINMGVRFFARPELKDNDRLELRICQESVDIALKYFTKRVIIIKSKDDIFKLLTETTSETEKFSDDTKESLAACDGGGSSIIIWAGSDEKFLNEKKELQFIFTAWLGKLTIRPLINVPMRKLLLSISGMEKEKVDEICNRIKSEEQVQSEKSKLNNPCWKGDKKQESDIKTEELKSSASPEDDNKNDSLDDLKNE